jgi:hypothetical protein
MKLNFWQILGLILLVIAVVLFARRKTATTDTVPPTAPSTNAPTTMPGTP